MRLYRACDAGEKEAGVAVVEFALVLPVLLLILLAMLDFGRAFNYWIDETQLASAGARWAIVNRNPASTGSLQQYIKSQADTRELKDGANVTICFPNRTSNVGDPVRVTVSYNFNWLGFWSRATSFALPPTISGSSTMRLEAVPTKYTSDGDCT
jgi:Flp pilus assembly protein TadG